LFDQGAGGNPLTMHSDFSRHWQLDPEVVFLNHGSFGACPIEVLDRQRRIRDRIERQPVKFFVRDYEPLIDRARADLADFLGVAAQDLAWVANATTGVNAVVRSLTFNHGDELITTNHEYNACRNALEFAADRAGARLVVVDIPFPVGSPDEVLDRVLESVTRRTRLALLDHVTSQTGLVLPIERLVAELEARGVDTLVDGAHAPGMLDLDIEAIGAAYYTGNCHKWLCAPKGAGFLHVRRDRQPEVRPVVISHGANSPRSDRSRFLVEFDWVGTDDPSAMLCVPDAIRFMGELLPGGWPELRARNRELVLRGRRMACGALGIPPPCPDEMIGSLAAMPLPDGSPEPPSSALYADPLQTELLDGWGIEAPVIPWPAPPRRLIRISAQIYNHVGHYELLAEALTARFGSPAMRGERGA
jgi:isopenicillin-N epimerase